MRHWLKGDGCPWMLMMMSWFPNVGDDDVLWLLAGPVRRERRSSTSRQVKRTPFSRWSIQGARTVRTYLRPTLRCGGMHTSRDPRTRRHLSLTRYKFLSYSRQWFEMRVRQGSSQKKIGSGWVGELDQLSNICFVCFFCYGSGVAHGPDVVHHLGKRSGHSDAWYWLQSLKKISILLQYRYTMSLMSKIYPTTLYVYSFDLGGSIDFWQHVMCISWDKGIIFFMCSIT